jgi:hypothetical protein
MSKESKSNCKYCHLPGHVIDKCPTIICKHCKAIGHPNWLCKNNPNAENVKSPLSPNLRNKKSIYAFDSTNSLSKSQSKNFDLKSESEDIFKEKNEFVTSINNLEHSNSFKTSLLKENKNDIKNDIKNENDIKNVYIGFKEDFKQKIVESTKVETPIINLQYYQKMINSKWGDLIETH